MNKEPIIFIDTEDMEERYAESLYIDYLKEENKQLKDKIDKTIEVIDTQMKLAEDGAKDNLRIIKFYLIKGSCSMYDLTTEEDYKYKKGDNNE